MFAVDRAALSDDARELLDELLQNFDEIDKDKSASLSIEEVDFYVTGDKARYTRSAQGTHP